jgi:hypothetical protein
MEIEPQVLEWPDEHTVNISGTTAIDAATPQVAVTVTSPSGRTYQLDPTPVRPDGNFATEFELHELSPEAGAPAGTSATRPHLELGRFQVTALSPGRFGSATATFAVTRTQEVDQYDWKEPADRLARRVFEIVANLKTCLANMPITPAREELRAQVDQLEKELQTGTGPGLGASLTAIMSGLGDFPDEVESLEEVIEPLEDQLDEWGKEADQLEHQLRHNGQRCSQGASCDRADLLAQDLDLLSSTMTFLRQPLELIGGYGNTAQFKEALGKQSMPDQAFWRQKVKEANAAFDTRPPGASGGGSSLSGWFSRVQIATERTRGLAQRELFQRFCQKFAGPVSASMDARAWSKGGQDWWKYEINLEGQLTLRYPSDASGATVPLTGELRGCATRFKSWDDALRVGWPKLMKGAVLFRTAREPFEGGGTCAPFDLPVTGELSGEELVLTLEPAARRDYGEPLTEVRYVVVSPLTIGLPIQTSFELPYKSAHFVWNRVLEGKPLKLPVRKFGEQLVVATELNATRGGERVEGKYTATIKACNPGCGDTGLGDK